MTVETRFDFASQRLKIKQGLIFSYLKITTGKAASLRQASSSRLRLLYCQTLSIVLFCRDTSISMGRC